MRPSRAPSLLALIAFAALLLAVPSVGAGGSGFDSKNLPAGGSYSFTFTEAGAFPYVCTLHAKMEGRVEVDANATLEGNATVAMKDNSFDPPVLRVKPGTTVTWINQGRQVHNAVGGDSANASKVPGLTVPAVVAALLIAGLVLRRRAP